jgi:hypothetical protein
MREHFQLSAARIAAARLDQMRVEFGLGHDEDLNWFNHTKVDGRLDSNRTRQIGKLESAIARTLADVQKLNDKDAKETKRAFTGYIAEYRRQVEQPYIHYGRTGDYMLHFEVRPEHYERGARDRHGGLNRDMGPDTGNRVVDMRFQNELEFNAYACRTEGAVRLPARSTSPDRRACSEEHLGRRPHGRSLHEDRRRYAALHQKLSERIRENKAYDADTKERMIREIVDSHLASMPERSPLKAQMFADLVAGLQQGSDRVVRASGRRWPTTRSSARRRPAAWREAFADINKAMRRCARRPAGARRNRSRELREADEGARQRSAAVGEHADVVDGLRALAAPWRLGLSACVHADQRLPAVADDAALARRHVRLRALDRDGRAYGKAFRA